MAIEKKVNGNLLLYSCLENSMDRGSLLATVHDVAESDMIEQLSTNIGVGESC